ncbi:MAG TPA: ATP-binding protein [Candidatus Bathyarchaeia archaeon]|nr:ATP-binding protein [Candidatus Bathyarchaeia archaeon]
MNCAFETPSLVYYAYLPIITLSIIAGIFIFFQGPKKPVNKNFFLFIFIFTLWAANEYTQWFVEDIKFNLFLGRLSIFLIFSILFFLFFVYALTGKNLSFSKKILFFLPFLPVIALSLSNYNLYMSRADNCTTESGILYWYVYFLAFFYAFWSVIVLYRNYRSKEVLSNTKNQLKIIMGSIIFLITWIVVVNRLYFFSESYSGGDAGWVALAVPYGMLLFIGLVIYAITRYSLFHIKLLAAQAIVVGLVILIGSEFLFADTTTNNILIGITLLLSIFFGWMLVRSVKLEVLRKEELESLSNELSVANDKLHQLDKAKSEFISIASHQLRTPLTSIKGFGSLLLEGTYGEVPDSQRGALEKIYISNERLIQLVEDLLNISRIEAGRMEFDFQEAQIEDLVQEAVNTLELSAKAKNLYLTWEKPAIPMPKIKIDITKIKEVISNMVDNAIKYTQKGGITVKLDKSTAWDTEHKDHKEFVRVIVSDTGIGMDDEEINMIFEKFQRGKQVARYHTDGTGLGMYIGKKIVAEHKGRIFAESDGKNKGSRFILELPIG